MITRPKRGDVRDDGYVFRYRNPKTGYEQWDCPASALRQRLHGAVSNAKIRSVRDAVPFDLDIDYVHSIYPKDGRCPVLGIQMLWGDSSGRDTSPSLDRKDPSMGYVKGNVAFISHRANRIKSDASLEDLKRIVTYYEA